MISFKRRVASVLLLCAPLAGVSETLHHVVAPAGGSTTVDNLRLSYSIGQPISGSIEAGEIRIHSGFQALFVSSSGTDVIFRNGFDPGTP